MTAAPGIPFRLATRWTPSAGAVAPLYELVLTNLSDTTFRDFELCISGPARIDPNAAVDGGRITARISNHTRIVPPEGFELAPGQDWRIAVHMVGSVLRHWNDGARGAYVALAGGGTAPVSVLATQKAGAGALRRGAERFPVPEAPPVPISVIPWPQQVSVEGRRGLPAGLAPLGELPEAQAAAAAFADLAAALFPAEALVRPAEEGGLPVRLTRGEGLGAEAYRLNFDGAEITLQASTHSGFLYGLITLGQIVRGARQYPEAFVFPASGTIEDAPETGWRGSHLDVARHFYTTAEVSRFLRILAWNKLNRFHWHLSDDEAWRIEVKAFPELTQIGAWRGEGLALPALLGTDAGPAGGYYTQEAVKQIVTLGRELGIETVPEIDIPGHSYAVLHSLPQLRGPDEAGEYLSVQGFPNNCLNPAHPPVYDFLERVIDELVELFPSRIIHIGADEVPLAAWSGSPLALERLAEIGGKDVAERHARLRDTRSNQHGADEIEGSTAALLQAGFLERVQSYIASKGCITGGWEEAAHGDVIDKSKSYLVGWRNVEVSASLAGQGYDMVVAPGQHYYLDMANSPEWEECGAGWAGWSGPKETYDFDPVQGWTAEQRAHFLGVQACIWSESMLDRAIFDRLVFPRLSAIAEGAWSGSKNKSWARFSALVGLMPVLYGHISESRPGGD